MKLRQGENRAKVTLKQHIMINRLIQETGVVICRFSVVGLQLFLCLALPAHSQEILDNWGKVQETELMIQDYNQFPDASAIVLFDKGQISFNLSYDGYTYNLIRHKRIHILNEDAIDLANFQIPYYYRDDIESVLDIDANTFSIENGELVKTKLDRKDIAWEKLDDKFGVVTLPLPKVKVGSIIEYTYRFRSKNVKFPSPWYFQTALPTLYSEFTFIRPENLEYAYLIMGDLNDSIKNDGGYCWKVNNLPALKDEPFVTSVEDYRQRIQFQMVGYQTGRGYKVEMMQDWMALNEFLLEHQYLGKQMKPNKKWRKFVKDISTNYSEPKARLEAAYRQIRDGFEWDGKRGLLISGNKLSDFFESRKGNSAAINLFLVAVLRELGFEANPVVASTRDNGLVATEYPIASQFNSLLCYVKVDEEIMLLDATDPFRDINLLAYQDLNSPVLLLDKDKPLFLNLPVNLETRKTTKAILGIDEDGGISGNFDQQSSGYTALEQRRALQNLEDDDFLRAYLGEEWDLSESELLEVKAKSDPEKDLKIRFSIDSEEFTRKVGERIYLSPMMMYQYEDNPFLDEERKLPIDFGYGFTEMYLLSFTIPEGYEVESIPKNVRVKLPNQDGKFEFLCVQNGSVIQVKSELKINQSYFPAEAYVSLKELFDNMLARHSEQIVMKRKS